MVRHIASRTARLSLSYVTSVLSSEVADSQQGSAEESEDVMHLRGGASATKQNQRVNNRVWLHVKRISSEEEMRGKSGV